MLELSAVKKQLSAKEQDIASLRQDIQLYRSAVSALKSLAVASSGSAELKGPTDSAIFTSPSENPAVSLDKAEVPKAEAPKSDEAYPV